MADIEKISEDTLRLLKSSFATRRPPPSASALAILNCRAGLANFPEESLGGEAYAPPFAETGSEDIEVVMQRLKTAEPPPKGAEPELVKISGVFFDCHLLYPGWWARSTTERRLPADLWAGGEGAVRNIRHWLNAGFEQWGPSWRLYDPQNPSPYVYGQIGHGDEANSIPVIVSRSIVRQLRTAMGSLHAISIVARGLMYHYSHTATQLPNALQSALQEMIKAAGGEIPYYLVVDPSLPLDAPHKAGQILLSRKRRDIYSAYMWQCLIREQDRAKGEAGTIPLEHTIFLWEHTNLLDRDSIRFNYEALLRKKCYLERQLGQKLLMLQQSYPVDQIVDDAPADPLIRPSVLSDILARTRARLHEAGPHTN